MNPREPQAEQMIEPETTPAPEQPDEAQGDVGGAFGYGRPAHRPDPEASYGFEPGAVRPLPVNPKLRWR